MTREIPLTQGRVALVDDADYDWLSQWKWCYVKTGKAHYAARALPGGGLIYMHRVILNNPDGKPVDHQDCDGLNNTRANLRVCTPSQNRQNAPKRDQICTSSFKGVSFFKPNGRWRSVIAVHRKQIFLGYFDSEIDAARAYNEAALKYHGEFARLNDLPA